ncbi:MAG: polysaccharide pyruvyl transferase family protein [Oscillatoria sp. PMC 1051.18]|nr:polysaccharide pyruvyl transferase family protein [Oscillatoria sp. PMC 1050.18]MEC5029768.1 polysaccharide pyruvyl transferase family protein [Oscillatoria sp. PMC 1051.18]
MNISQPKQITQQLHAALTKIGTLEKCAFLDYPNYPNIGDHLIWLGALFYLTDVLQTKVSYTANINNFSDELLKQKVGKNPIILNGGGNLGDLWLPYQKFREKIIFHYQDRPIIILPQSIYFAKQTNLTKAAKIFNSHPNLTIFVRDNYSYQIASKNFGNCQVVKAPDMAFHLLNLPGITRNCQPNKSILYHYRQDRELDENISPASLNIPNLVVEDWQAFHLVLGNSQPPFLKKIAYLYREFWQKGILTPDEFFSRRKWLNKYKYKRKFSQVDNPELQQLSLSLLHAGIYQFQQYQVIITNRLHGHILCLLLGIPHLFLPNSYHKNESFYQTWSKNINWCHFAKNSQEVQVKIREIFHSSIN